jgi:hypothetical protein
MMKLHLFAVITNAEWSFGVRTGTPSTSKEPLKEVPVV